MVSKVIIFEGYLQTNQLIKTDPMGDATVIYLVAPLTNYEIEIEAFAQIRIDDSFNRLASFYLGSYKFNTQNVLIIPQELRGIGEEKYLALSSDIVEYAEVWAITPDPPATHSDILSLSAKFDLLLYPELLQSSDVGNLSFAVALANPERKVVEIINTSDNEIFLARDRPASPSDYDVRMLPISVYRIYDFTGEIYAYAETASRILINEVFS